MSPVNILNSPAGASGILHHQNGTQMTKGNNDKVVCDSDNLACCDSQPQCAVRYHQVHHGSYPVSLKRSGNYYLITANTWFVRLCDTDRQNNKLVFH